MFNDKPPTRHECAAKVVIICELDRTINRDKTGQLDHFVLNSFFSDDPKVRMYGLGGIRLNRKDWLVVAAGNNFLHDPTGALGGRFTRVPVDGLSPRLIRQIGDRMLSAFLRTLNMTMTPELQAKYERLFPGYTSEGVKALELLIKKLVSIDQMQRNGWSGSEFDPEKELARDLAAEMEAMGLKAKPDSVALPLNDPSLTQRRADPLPDRSSAFDWNPLLEAPVGCIKEEWASREGKLSSPPHTRCGSRYNPNF